MRLSDLPGRKLTIVRDRTGIHWVFINGRVRWAVSLRAAFAIVDELALKN